jgi:hypothetical protein
MEESGRCGLLAKQMRDAGFWFGHKHARPQQERRDAMSEAAYTIIGVIIGWLLTMFLVYAYIQFYRG